MWITRDDAEIQLFLLKVVYVVKLKCKTVPRSSLDDFVACTKTEHFTFGNFNCFQPNKAVCFKWCNWGKEINIQQERKTNKKNGHFFEM